MTDVCVPISRLAECVTATKQDIRRTGLVAPIVGHAGDGNFHASVLVMMDDAEEVARANAFIERVAERSLAMEGSPPANTGLANARSGFLKPSMAALPSKLCARSSMHSIRTES